MSRMDRSITEISTYYNKNYETKPYGQDNSFLPTQLLHDSYVQEQQARGEYLSEQENELLSQACMIRYNMANWESNPEKSAEWHQLKNELDYIESKLSAIQQEVCQKDIGMGL